MPESKTLPLKLAYSFLESKNLKTEAAAIRASHGNLVLTKGKIVDLLERNHLLGDFIKSNWPNGEMADGRRRIERYKRALRNEEVLEDSEQSEEEELDESLPSLEPVDKYAFALEKYLEDFIVRNFDNIFKGGLKIFKDIHGVNGQQYNTDIGIIDILAFEPTTKSFVVIELKKGRPADRVVGQILRYMGWVKERLCPDGQKVKGLVVCRDEDVRLKYALDMVQNVSVRYYHMSFALKEKPEEA